MTAELKTETEPSDAAGSRRVVVALGDKGGSSKSFLIRRLHELHSARPRGTVLGVDGDSTVGHLLRFYGGANVEPQVLPFNLHADDLDERERFTNTILRETAARLVVTDFPATSLTILRKMEFDGINFAQSVTDAGFRLTVLAPITPYDDSLFDLQQVIALFDPTAHAKLIALSDAHADDATVAREKKKIRTNADYVAAVNIGANAESREDFELWDDPASLTRKLLAFVGGVELEFPRLRSRIAAKIARHSVGFRQASTMDFLTPTDVSRLTRWLRDSETAFRSAGPLLGFD